MSSSRARLTRKIGNNLKVEQGVKVDTTLGPMTSVSALSTADSITISDQLPTGDPILSSIRRTIDDPTGVGEAQEYYDDPSTRNRTFSGLASGTQYVLSTTPVGLDGTLGPKTDLIKSTTVVTGVRKLPWAPPTGYQNFIVKKISMDSIHIGTNSTRTVFLDAGKDYRLVWVGELTRRVRISGGRHVVIIGGASNINVNNGGYYEKAESYSNNGGLEPVGQTGTVFIEGYRVYGEWAMDSIRSHEMRNADVVLQNCRLENHKMIAVGDVYDKKYHTDGFQCWRGPKSLKMYNVTIINVYQGGMIGDGALSEVWGNTHMERVNYRYSPIGGQATRLINWVNGPYGKLHGPFVWKDVYYLPAPNAVWGTATVVKNGLEYDGGALYSHMPVGIDAQGRHYGQLDKSRFPAMLGASDGAGGPLRVYKGLPPEGDYCPEGVAGMNYISPGYQTTVPVPTIDLAINAGDRDQISTGHSDGAFSVRLKFGTDAAVTLDVVYSAGVTPNARGTAKHTVPAGLPVGVYWYKVLVTTTAGEGVSSETFRWEVLDPNRNVTTFSFTSCLKASDTSMFTSMANWLDDYFIFLGDLWYADGTGTGITNFRSRMRGRIVASNLKKLMSTIRTFYKADDHDGMNDDSFWGIDNTAWGNFNIAIREYFPFLFPTSGHYTYKDDGNLRIVILDERSAKSKSGTPTALGSTQKAWLFNLIDTCPNDKVLVLCCGSPWVSAADATDDAWAGFDAERTEIANRIVANHPATIAIGGDQHALSYKTTVGAPGDIAVYQAAPAYNTSSHKGGPWDDRTPSSEGVIVSQYARIKVTRDTAARTLTVEYWGYRGTSTTPVLTAPTKTFTY